MNTEPRISLSEELICLPEVPEVIPKPRNGRKVSIGSVYRWVSRGLAGAEPLEVLFVGGVRYTSREALARFFERVTHTKLQRSRSRAPYPEPGIDSKAADRAEAELNKIGI